uniref:Chemosensory protein 8 n=1 Tax=Chrysopa pallens TaxID=417485 RepID=A0A0R8P1Y9_CHRPA|nr:chemosensory protein 8 [Chrysopa pallens]
MKSVTLAVFVIVAFAAIGVYAEEDKYTSKFDNIDVDSILANDRLLKNYMDCVAGKGKCTPDGEALKKHSKEALDNCCAKCTDKQKEMFKKIYKHLQTNKPEVLAELKQQYDPTGEHAEKCKSQLEGLNN